MIKYRGRSDGDAADKPLLIGRLKTNQTLFFFSAVQPCNQTVVAAKQRKWRKPG